MNLPGNIAGADLIIDTETTGLNVMKDRPLFLAWRVGPRFGTVRWSEPVVNWLNDNLPLAHRVVAHNFKYDAHLMIQGGVNPSVIDYIPAYCTMVGEQLCDEYRLSYTLDALGSDIFAMGKINTLYQYLADKFGGEADYTQLRHLSHAPLEAVEEYSNRDTLLCQKLFDRQKGEFDRQGLHQIAEIEMQVTQVLMRMERRGAPIFMDRAEQSVYAMREAIDKADDDLWQTVGYRTNPRSTPELTYAFHHLGLPPMKSFDREHLLLVDHPVASKILDYRQILVAQDVFVLRLQDFVGPDGRIHCNFNQNRHDDGGTHTGRLSSTHPNLQQIPARVEAVAKLIRSLFGEKGKSWVSGDWNQFEYRIFGHFVGDDNVLHAYRTNPKTDFHGALAEITGIVRGSAKRINLGLVFAMGEGKLAKMLGMPHRAYMDHGRERYEPGEEAKALFAQYHARVPKTRPYLQASAREAEAKGYITTLLGRRVRFPDRSKAYKAGGLRFQASAADLMKKKLIEVDRALMSSGLGSELILAIHDEFDAVCPEGTEEQTCKIMREVMEDVPELQLPVLAEVSHGSDWWEASS